HTQFRQPDNSLYREEVVSSKGFSGIYSILYHINPPTRVRAVGESVPYGPRLIQDYGLRHTHLNTSRVETTGDDYLSARKLLLADAECATAVCAAAQRRVDYLDNAAGGDEVIFVHDGEGVHHSPAGKLAFRKGDHVVIPRAVIYRLEFGDGPLRH